MFFLKAKSDASAALRDAVRVYKAHGKLIKVLRTDQGGEYGGGKEGAPKAASQGERKALHLPRREP